jgi:hypothetical protein
MYMLSHLFFSPARDPPLTLYCRWSWSPVGVSIVAGSELTRKNVGRVISIFSLIMHGQPWLAQLQVSEVGGESDSKADPSLLVHASGPNFCLNSD